MANGYAPLMYLLIRERERELARSHSRHLLDFDPLDAADLGHRGFGVGTGRRWRLGLTGWARRLAAVRA